MFIYKNKKKGQYEIEAISRKARIAYIIPFLLLVFSIGQILGQTPYGGIPRTIPGLIEAEEYDNGGASIAYYDLTASNNGGEFRADDVDISSCIEGGHKIRDWQAGEWMLYTVNTTASTYNINFRVGTTVAGNRIKIYLDNVLLLTATLENTGGNNTYKTLTFPNIPISGGNGKKLKVESVDGGVYLNWIEFEDVNGKPASPGPLTLQTMSSSQIELNWFNNSLIETGYVIERKPYNGSWSIVGNVGANIAKYTDSNLQCATAYFYRVSAINTKGSSLPTSEQTALTSSCSFSSPYGGAPRNIPGKIEAEDYDQGGQDKAYNDGTSGNNGGDYRMDNVDISACNEGGYKIRDWTAGEWMVYTVNVLSSRYNINVRIGTAAAGKSIKVYLDNALISTISLPNTGSNNTYQTVTVPNIALTGGKNKKLKVESVDGGIYLNWIELVDVGQSSGGGFKPQYNGNIAAIRWKTTGSSDVQNNQLKEYDFTYDSLNRLKASQYLNITNSTYKGIYSEDSIRYDLNGNILQLRRIGFDLSNNRKEIDKLTYTYSSNSNRLRSIADAGEKKLGFIDSIGVSDEYLYDENGNMYSDINKGILIQYNFLNLPSKISKGKDSIIYVYDAAGTKLCKKVYKNGALSVTIDYCGETEFYNNQLKYLHTEEGMVEYQNASSFTYEYFLKDHLGNTRAVVSSDASGTLIVGQVSSYYPFGMAHTGVPKGSNMGSDNKYLYNGKELQDESLGGYPLGLYDYGARFYDPQIGRWHSVDPRAEDMRRFSPYAYVADNPIINIDPDGEFLFTAIGAAVGAISSATRQLVHNGGTKNFSWKEVGKSAVAGAVAGAVIDITVATGGTGGVLIAAGAVSGMAGEATSQALHGTSNIGDIVKAGAWGLGLGMASEMLPGVMPVLKGMYKKPVVETEPIIEGPRMADDAANAADDILQGGNRLPDERIIAPPPKRGNAPIGDDGYPVELHHRKQQDGTLDEYTRTDHRGGDNYSRNHSNTGQEPSKINRTEFKKQRKDHWNKEWDNGRFN